MPADQRSGRRELITLLHPVLRAEGWREEGGAEVYFTNIVTRRHRCPIICQGTFYQLLWAISDPIHQCYSSVTCGPVIQLYPIYSSVLRVTRVLLMDANLSITLLFRSPELRSFGKPNSDPFQYLWGDLNFFKVFRERTWEDGFPNQSSLWLPAGWNWVQSLTQLVQVSEQILYILNFIHIIIFQIITWPQRSGQTQLSMRGIISIGQWQSWRKVKCDDWSFSGEHWTVC